MKKFMAWTLALAILLAGMPAGAQKVGNTTYVPSGTSSTASATVTGSATLVLAATTVARFYLVIHNRSTDNVWCSFSTATPTVGGAGTWLLAGQGANRTFLTFIPKNALYCISAGTSSGITAEYAP